MVKHQVVSRLGISILDIFSLLTGSTWRRLRLNGAPPRKWWLISLLSPFSEVISGGSVIWLWGCLQSRRLRSQVRECLQSRRQRSQERALYLWPREMVLSRLESLREATGQLWGLLVLPVLGCWHSKCTTGVCWGYNILDRYSRYLSTYFYVRMKNRLKLKQLGSKFGLWISLGLHITILQFDLEIK